MTKTEEVEANSNSKSDDPVLDLDTLSPDRPTIRVRTPDNREGELFELATVEDLSIEDQQFMQSNGREMDRLMSAEKLNKSQRQKLSQILDGMVRKVLFAPDEVVTSLNDWHKEKVVNAFIMASPELREAAQMMMGIDLAPNPTGEN